MNIIEEGRASSSHRASPIFPTSAPRFAKKAINAATAQTAIRAAGVADVFSIFVAAICSGYREPAAPFTQS